MDLSAIALQGLEQAGIQLEKAATSLASSTALSNGSNVDIVDLSTEIVALLSAKNQFSVQVATLKVADEVQQNAVNLIA